MKLDVTRLTRDDDFDELGNAVVKVHLVPDDLGDPYGVTLVLDPTHAVLLAKGLLERVEEQTRSALGLEPDDG